MGGDVPPFRFKPITVNVKKFLADDRWAQREESASWLIGLTTFALLALELAVIRWTTSQVRVFAYFNNVVLIGAFLGLGLGVALGRRWPGLVHFTLPVLLVLSVPLAFSERLGLVHLVFPDSTILLFGGEIVEARPVVFLRNISIFLGLWLGVVATFVCGGAPLGHLFPRLPVLRAYAADLTGSLLGVVGFTAAAWLQAGPAVWLALGCLPFVWLVRRWWALAVAAMIIALGQYSVRNAIFSPYNRIVLTSPNPLYQELEVNRDYHQSLHDLSDAHLASPSLSPTFRDALGKFRQFYDLPFVINSHRGSALIVGGGTGNDAQAALRNGYAQVTNIDIDARILALGRGHHPERPYDDPRVTNVVADARAFFDRRRDDRYDVVCYGLLDSHAMSSAMSTLRLDNYVYTEEGIRAAWEKVGPGGHLSLAISCYAGPWFFNRIYWTITRATGKPPLAFYDPLLIAATFVVARDGVHLDVSRLPAKYAVGPASRMDQTLTTSDDWPFLYVRPGIFPWGYAVVLGFIVLLALATVRPVFGLGKGGAAFDWPLFLMGAAFMLIETRGITSLSLLFGSTWLVNSAIFGGILIMVLIGNAAVRRWQWRDPRPWFLALFPIVALLWFFHVEWLHVFPFALSGLAGGLLTGLPVGLAGVIVPILLQRSATPAASLGANLLGAVLGGCLEYYSMLGGLRSTALMALVLYLVAFLLLRGAKNGNPARG